MTKTIAVLNQKGGVGKTTITAHLAMALFRAGFSVRLIDSDEQGSLRDWRAASVDEQGEVCKKGNNDYSIPVVGYDRGTLAQDIKEEIKSNNHDFLIVDGRAKSEKIAGAAVRVADLVIIPVAPSALDVWAVEDLTNIIKARHEVTDGKPKTYFLINNAKDGTKLVKEVLPAVEEYGLNIFNVLIHNREVYKQTMGEGATAYIGKNTSAIKEIEQFKNEVLEALKQ